MTIQSIFAHKIPDSLSDESAALLEPLSVGIWACQKARIGLGSRVFIAGAGPIGTITAQAARGYGASEVIVSDLMEDRRKRVMEFGATRTIDPAKESVRDLGVDAFIDCSGATPAIQSGITAVRNAGHVVLVGMGADEVPLPLPIIQVRELTVTGTFRYAGTWPVAAAMASQGKLNLDALITSKYDLEHVREALEASLDPSSLKPFVYP